MCHCDLINIAAGKSLLMDLAIYRYFEKDIINSLNGKKTMKIHKKAVYLSPLKALCDGKFKDSAKKIQINIILKFNCISL